MLLKISLIIFLITIQLFAIAPGTILDQLKDDKQYLACQKIKNFDQKWKCESDIENLFIEKGVEKYIQSFDEKYQNSVRNKMSELKISQQGDVLDLYAKISPLLDSNHTPKELMKIKYNIIFYYIAHKNISSGNVASAKMIFQAAPELKNKYAELDAGSEVNVYTYIMNEAADYDEIANLSFKNAQDYFDKLKMFLIKRKQDIKDAKVDSDDRVVRSYNEIINSIQSAAEALKKGDLESAKRILSYTYLVSHDELDGFIYLAQLYANINKIFSEEMNKRK